MLNQTIFCCPQSLSSREDFSMHVSIYECESTGGSEWVLEQTVHLDDFARPSSTLDPRVSVDSNLFVYSRSGTVTFIILCQTKCFACMSDRLFIFFTSGLTCTWAETIAHPTLSTTCTWTGCQKRMDRTSSLWEWAPTFLCMAVSLAWSMSRLAARRVWLLSPFL